MPSVSPVERLEQLVGEMEAKTGKSVADWAKMADASGLAQRKDRAEWLMQKHGMGRIVATVIAGYSDGSNTDYRDQELLLNAMYAGPKSALRPIYDRLVEVGTSLGPDFGLYQCGAQTTFKRERQFAWIKPATRTRVDLRLALPGVLAHGRLLPVNGSNEKDRVRVRIALSSVGDVDDEVAGWLKRAYELEQKRG